MNKLEKILAYALAVLLVAFAGVQAFAGLQAELPKVDEPSYPVPAFTTNLDDLAVSTITTTGNATIGGALSVTGATTQTGAQTFSGAVTINNNLVVTGTANLQGTISDSAGDVTIGDNLAVTGTSDLQGNISDSAGTLTIADNTLVDGAADAIQLQVQGYTTQTSSLAVFEQSDGTDVATLSNAGALDIASTFNFGANDLYPLGFASSGQQAFYSTASITGTATIAHGLTTVTFALCTLGEDPTSGAGDAAMCTVTVAANVVTAKVWQDDFVTAATETDVDVHVLVIGAP